jgi:UDP-N-acetylmuramate dehydrogenase
VENLTGIPGKVGSCPVQNIGAYGVEVKDVITEVHALEIATKKTLVLANSDCKFGYRDSIFKNELKNKVIITSVVFQLSKIEKYNLSYKALNAELQDYSNMNLALVQEKIKEIRGRKLPDTDEVGSAGSFFKNSVIQKDKFEALQKVYPQLSSFETDDNFVKLAAAQLIELSGWKGFRDGDAGVYPLQPLVLVNYGNATGAEIMNLAERIQQSVFETFSVKLECEAQMV